MINKLTQGGLKDFGLYSEDIDGIMGPNTQDAISKMLQSIRATNDKLGYPSLKDYNLIGIRMSDTFTNQFSDWGVITHGESLMMFPMSTKPGVSYFANKQYIDSVKGCACLKEGYYKNMWRLSNNGWSGMPYLAQISPVSIYRDSNMDTILDRNTIVNGLFGINFHSWIGFVGQLVMNLSAGCQVFTADVHNDIWLYITEMAKLGDIDYRLFNITDFNQ